VGLNSSVIAGARTDRVKLPRIVRSRTGWNVAPGGPRQVAAGQRMIDIARRAVQLERADE
jgi:hypothetical protein